jgi:protein SCO1
MKTIIKIIYISILPFIAGLYGCGKSDKVSGLPYYNTPDFTPLWLSSREASAENIHTISDFSFINQDGKSITNSDFEGKIYAANFFFTSCPSICPNMTKNMLKVQQAFEKDDDVKLVSHSVMPWADSVAALKNYEKTFNIKNGMWELVTGNTSQIYELARKSYFAEEEAGFNSDSTEFLHTEHVLLIDREGYIRGVYNGTLPLEIERMIEDIKILKKEDA